MLSLLLDACTDELVSLAEEAGVGESVVKRIRARIEELFGPKESASQPLALHRFVAEQLERPGPQICPSSMPNRAKSGTGGRHSDPARCSGEDRRGPGPQRGGKHPGGGNHPRRRPRGGCGDQFEVADTGVGITPENQTLLFENYFTAYETMQYSSGRPYDFNAGGKGFDLLRMKIFSERYHFSIRITSDRCCHIPTEDHLCPGDIARCVHCRQESDCASFGGTTVQVVFPRAEIDRGERDRGNGPS